MNDSRFTLWLLCDGKRGHENQAIGLAEALRRRKPFRVETIRLPHDEPFRVRRRLLREAIGRLPEPDLVVGAGHSTHFLLVWAAWKTGARSVVLMKPTLPEILFDFCVIPAHDLRGRKSGSPRRLVTLGAVNRMRCDPGLKEKRGILLIGGPSGEHGWHGENLLSALKSVVGSAPDYAWVLTTSRRTPEGFLDTARKALPNVECFDAAETDADWLPGQLARAETAWVSGDSVSMVYEALTAGARVGLLEMPLRGKPGKLARGAADLMREGFVTPWARWRETRRLSAPPRVLAEADRCAAEILRRLERG